MKTHLQFDTRNPFLDHKFHVLNEEEEEEGVLRLSPAFSCCLARLKKTDLRERSIYRLELEFLSIV